MRGVDNSFVVVQRRIEFFSCLRRLTFFLQQKKVSKKCRPQTPGGLHSANRLYANTKEGGLSSLDGQRTSAANRTHALCTLIAY